VLVHVRHASASGRIDQWWSYANGRIQANVRQGAATLALDFAVCSYGLPVFGAHPIMRIDGETWAVHPVRFVREWPGGVESLHALPCSIADVLGHGAQLIITQAPHVVSAELETL